MNKALEYSTIKTKVFSKKKLHKILINNYQYYMLALPAILLFVVFRYLPMAGLSIAFKDFSPAQGIFNSPWVGIKWFKILFINEDFISALRNTVLISFYKLAFSFPAPIILALMLNEVSHKGFKKSVQGMIYLPHFISWAVLAGIVMVLLSPSSGILSVLGIDKSPLMAEKQFRAFLVLSDIWKESGWGTIVYLAAISGISPELYEAATIDGATRFQKISYITLPCISNTIVVLFILKLGHVMDAGFNQVYMLYNPAVMKVGDILDTYVFRVGLSSGRISLAAAAGFFKAVVGLALVLAANKLVKTYKKEYGFM